MARIDQCYQCGQELTAVPIGEDAVVVDGCQNCSSGVVNVHYNPIPDREDSGDIRSRTNMSCSSLREKLTEMNIKKVEPNDKIELKNEDGSVSKILITQHEKHRERITGRPKGENEVTTLSYEQVFQRDGYITFKYSEQRESWDGRPDIPWDFPMSDSRNERTLLESVRRGYVRTINYLQTPMEVISVVLTRAIEFGLTFLAKGLVSSLKLPTSPFITCYYIAWGHGSLKEKLAAGEITQTEYEQQCEWYRGYFGKAAIVGGCVVGGVAALGAKWYLSNCVRVILVEQLTIVWTEISEWGGVRIAFYVQRTISLLEAKTAVEGLELLCLLYPQLGEFVAFVGGAEVFLACGAITLIVGGGLLGWYLHKKWASREALEQLATEIDQGEELNDRDNASLSGSQFQNLLTTSVV